MLCWGLGLTLTAFLLHLLVWRVRLPGRQTRALLVIFAGTWVAAALLWWGDVFPAGIRPSGPEFSTSGMLLASLAMAYVITYSALEADSPSLVMVGMIQKAGPEGLPREKFLEMAGNEVLIDPRLRDLVLNRQCRLEEGKYILTFKGIGMLRLIMFWRRLLGTGKGG